MSNTFKKGDLVVATCDGGSPSCFVRKGDTGVILESFFDGHSYSVYWQSIGLIGTAPTSVLESLKWEDGNHVKI